MKQFAFLTLFTVCISLLTSLTSQAQNTWIGGFPGHKTDWNIAANWSMYRVPDEWEEVYIPNTSTTTFVYPVIEHDVGMISSIRMGYDARIIVTETGRIGILNQDRSSGNIQQLQIFSNQIVDATALK